VRVVHVVGMHAVQAFFPRATGARARKKSARGGMMRRCARLVGSRASLSRARPPRRRGIARNREESRGIARYVVGETARRGALRINGRACERVKRLNFYKLRNPLPNLPEVSVLWDISKNEEIPVTFQEGDKCFSRRETILKLSGVEFLITVRCDVNAVIHRRRGAAER